MPKWIVGIGAYSHDSSVAFLRDGEIVFSAEEERFDREKHSEAFPRLALQAGMAHLGLKPEDISNYAYFFAPIYEIVGNAMHMVRYFPASLSLLRGGAAGSGDSYLGKLKNHHSVGNAIRDALNLDRAPKVDFIRHHLSHAASAFYASPYEEAAILTLDGRGEDVTVGLFYGAGTEIKWLQKIKVPHSLGHLYAAITSYLGFRAFFDEWKVMGMSAYGKGTLIEEFKDLAHWDGETFKLNLEYFLFHTHGFGTWIGPKFYERFGPGRIADEPLEQRHFEMAHALQKLVEELALELTRSIYKKTGSKNLCLAGGVGFNVLMNRRILADGPFDNFYVHPVSGDGGASMGAALQSYYQQGFPRERRAFVSPYLGPEFSGDQVLVACRARGLEPAKPAELETKTAQALAAGKVVAWFQGRLEAGPRALGNRSILADPGRKDMKDILNLRTKRRESFRPFAPSVLREKADQYFVMPKGVDSPYMILSGYVREEMRERLPAITHVDGSARVHTVDRAINPRYHRLLEEFEKLTGLPVLLNTSFNESEPIVCRPEEALDCFQRTEIDVLVMGDYWLEKS